MTVVDATTSHWVALVERIRDHGDQAAFVALFRHFAPRIKGYLIKSGAAEAMAEECTQEVMATLWHKAHLYDPCRASVSTWIFTIARNKRADMLRRQRYPEPEEIPWGPEECADQADVVLLQQEVDRLAGALAGLPDEQRELIEQAFFGDLTHTQLAAITGLPLGTIKSRIRLGLERLKRDLA